jgi:hypothetical protein
VDGNGVGPACPPHDNAFGQDEDPAAREDEFGAATAGFARVLDVEVLNEGNVGFISDGRAAEKTGEGDEHGKEAWTASV